MLKLLAVLILSLVFGAAHAEVDWDDGFEYADGAAAKVNWSGSCSASDLDSGTIMGLSTERAHSGTKSLRLNFVGHADSGCWLDRNLGGASSILYTRFWMYMENFTVDGTSTKMVRQDLKYTEVDVWWAMFWGQPQLTVVLQFSAGTTQKYYGTPHIPQNQWVCVETYFNQGTPGNADGAVQAWINGTQALNQTGLSLLPGGASATSQSYVRHYRQNGTGVIFYDDFAVSRDARITCGGSPPAAPGAPQNLQVQ